MEEIKDTCAICGKEIVIKDKNMIANLKNIKGKSTAAKLYCSEECRKKAKFSIEGSLDISRFFLKF